MTGLLALGTVFLSCTLFAAAAQAQSRPSSLTMSCSNAQRLVATRGAIVLGTGGFTYDRFVSSKNFCQFDEALERAFVPTTDTPQCFIGYTCQSGPPEIFDR